MNFQIRTKWDGSSCYFIWILISLIYKGHDEMKSRQAKHVMCVLSFIQYPPSTYSFTDFSNKCWVQCGLGTGTAHITKPQFMPSRSSQPGGGEVLFMLLSILNLWAIRGVRYLTQVGHQRRLLAVLTPKKVLKFD